MVPTPSSGTGAPLRTAGVVFDLDDTLYLERDYVRSGFQAVASVCHDSVDTRAQISRFLWDGFRNGVRDHAFDRLLERYPLLRDAVQVHVLIDVYRRHEPDIRLLPGIGGLLDALRDGGKYVAVLTDGHPISQQRKLDALALKDRIDDAVITDHWGIGFRKPHRRGYDHLQQSSGLPGSRLTYVGDNPTKDFVTARRLGWHTIRFQIPGQLYAGIDASDSDHAANVVASSIESLRHHLFKERPFARNEP